VGYTFKPKLSTGDKTKRKRFFPYFVIGLIIVAYLTVVLLLPAPKVKAEKVDVTAPPTSTASISWPKDVQSALGAQGYGVLATNGEQKSVPIASIAKTILALAVLKEKPLILDQPGPQITITQSDVELYKSHLAQNGSVLPITLNEKLSEYQMLQGLMIPSGNNIADTLATWAFGSVSNYLNYANQMVKDMGLTQTIITDASGFSPQTTSSAHDLVIIGEKAMNEPVLKQIVAQKDVTLPTAGLVKNYNTLLEVNNIIGIKTGNSDEAGGCFLLAAQENMDGKDVIIIYAVLGAKSRNEALQFSNAFILGNAANFKLLNVAKKGQIVGKYKPSWGKEVNAIASEDVNILLINGEKLSTDIKLNDIQGNKNKGDQVGEINASAGSEKIAVPITLDGKVSGPSFLWRIFHL
jgi:D-alanyl-D-alanine carboxypeptidase (penicillin-binding protein 5/6)